MSSLLLAVLLSADFSGIWVGTIELQNGRTEDVSFEFVQKGSALSGKQYDDMESTPLVKGTVSGDLISFVLVRQEQAGNEINQTRIRFSGKLVGNEIEVFRERESSTRSGSNAGAFLRNNARQAFKLRRLR
jgi:hypothetical protein